MSKNFLPGLHGIRAIAAIAVIFSHTTAGLDRFGLDNRIFGLDAYGNVIATDLAGFGVSMFFSLSGFLITYLLLREKQAGTVRIGKFYMRRVLRIFPLYYLYLGLVLLFLTCFGMGIDFWNLMLYIFLLGNIPFILGTPIDFLGHFWSLGVEEQFYLFWPFLVKKVKNLMKWVLILLFTLIALKLGARFYDVLYHQSKPSLLYTILHVNRFQCMIIGGIGGILFIQNHPVLRFVRNRWVEIGVWVVFVLAACNRFHIASVLDNEFIAFVTVVLIIQQVSYDRILFSMDKGIFNWLGTISYGLYVFHPLVLLLATRFVHFEEHSIWNYLLSYGIVFSGTIAVSYLSYMTFERFFLRIKERKFTASQK